MRSLKKYYFYKEFLFMNKVFVKKGEIIQRNGDLNTKMFKVEKGLLRSYFVDEKGKEHIYIFAPEGWIMADGQAANSPCDLFIDALEDSELEITSIEKVDDFMPQKLLNRLGVLQKRIIMLQSATAIERYEHFENTYPNIVQRVPQKMIASYLGITPEALSKVKSQRLK